MKNMKTSEMKKLLFIMSLMVIAVMFSCVKEVCYECVSQTFAWKAPNIMICESTTLICNYHDMDALELLNYELDHTYYDNNTFTTCECKRK